MQVSYNSIGNSLLELGFANTGLLKLHKGEVVQAVVEKILGEGLLRINIKGMTVEAATTLRFNPGQQLLLRAEGIENGRQILRIINPAEEQSSKVTTILRELGYKTDERLNAITVKLMQYGLPLTRENIDYVLNTTRLLGEFTPLNLEIAAWALASKVEGSPEFLNALRSFLTAPQSIKTLVQQILQGLPSGEIRTEAGTTAGATVVQQFAPNTSQADGIQNPQIPGRPEPLPSSAAGPSPQPVSQPVSRDGPTGTSAASTSNSMPINPNPVRTGAQSPQFAAVNRPVGEIAASGLLMPRLDSIRELFAAMESVMNLKGTDPPETAQVNLRNFIRSNKEFVKALLLIREVLSRFPETAAQMGEQVVQLVTAAEEEVLGQTIFNSVEGRGNNQQPGFCYFAIPLEVAGQNRVMELRIYKDAQGKRRLSELGEIRVAVGLDTANLGRVVFHVTWKTDDTLQIQGAIDRREALEIIEGSIDTLLERLTEKGFKVDYRGMKLVQNPQPLRPGLETIEFNLPVLGIDITV